jgi:hypothetical protein
MLGEMDSGFDATHRPGMTAIRRHTLAFPRFIHPSFAKHRPSENRGRGECRVLKRTRSLAWENKNHTSVVTTVAPVSPGIPAREWF